MNPILKKTRNPLRIAKELDISHAEARRLVKECDQDLQGWGELRKQHNIISRRHVSQEWPDDVSHFQKLHDQGKVNLCQGRDGNHFILYAQYNNPPVHRRVYFFTDRGY